MNASSDRIEDFLDGFGCSLEIELEFVILDYFFSVLASWILIINENAKLADIESSRPLYCAVIS